MNNMKKWKLNLEMVATGESIVFCLVRMYNLALIVILKLTETQVIK